MKNTAHPTSNAEYLINYMIKHKLVILHFVMILYGNFIYAQQPELLLTPNGVMDKVFDQRGVAYNLSDLMINTNSSEVSRSVLVNCSTTSIFNLYFEPGCGMDDTSNALHNSRRAVVCKVFQDLSDFITAPGSVLSSSSATKVNIWVRNINNVFTSPNGVLGMASGFYCLPSSTTSGGITDNEIWKTIHTGVDSYLNLTVPITAAGGGSNQAGLFYHGMVTFNFNDTASPPIPNTTPLIWNTNLATTTIPNTQFDLYSVVLHEVTHALGFNSLIGSNGTSQLGPNRRYFNRYDTFLKINDISLLTTPTCSMYDNVFNTSTQVLQPNISSCGTNSTCTEAIRFKNQTATLNVPVYTPNCFNNISSLSHFEDTHYPTCNTTNPIYGNDNYFLMCNAGNSGMIRRYLKPEERTTLCEIGYQVKATYGVSGAYINGTATSFNYGGGACAGISVAGVNDGIGTLGTYIFSGTVSSAATGAQATINLNCATILSNDVGATGGFTCLQDLTATAALPTTLSGTSGTLTSGTITFMSSLPGLHLLRYVPINAGGQIGNITYIYVFVEPFVTSCTTPANVCSLIRNGDLEANNVNVTIEADFGFNKVCNWQSISTFTSYYLNNSTFPLRSVPCNYMGCEPDRIANNHAYGGIMCYSSTAAGGLNASGMIATRLTTPLSPQTNYELRFDVSQAEFLRYTNYQIQALLTSVNPSTFTGYTIPTAMANSGVLLQSPTTISTRNGWVTLVFNFPTGTLSNLEYLYLGVLNNPLSEVGGQPETAFDQEEVPQPHTTTWFFANQTGSFYYLDNVSLIPTSAATLDLPASICINQSLPNLSNYLTAVPTNGTFSGNGVTLTGGIYTFNPSAFGGTTVTINYNYTNNLGCPLTLTDTINVINTPLLTPIFNIATSLCNGSVAPLLPTTSTNGVTGTWSPATVSNTTSGSYTFTPTLGTCANAVTIAITVIPAPQIKPLTQTVCLNATPQILNVIPIAGLSYQWYSNTTNTVVGGTLIAGATNTSYTPIVTTIGTKYYYVKATLIGVGCVLTSNVVTVIVANGSVNAGTLSGNQILCKFNKLNPETTFTATVPGGTWTSSNTSIAGFITTAAASSNSIGIMCGVGTATITYTVTSPTGCKSSVTRTVTTVLATIPTFAVLPTNASGFPNPIHICTGAAAPILPTTSANGITGSWSPAVISNTFSGNYTFTPTAGLCAQTINLAVIVDNANNFVANDDYFTVNMPLAPNTVVTGSILNNDTYLGNGLSAVPSGSTYNIVTLGTAPTFAAGGILFNANGTYTVFANTTPGSYTYTYRLTTNCGLSNIATVTIVVGSYVQGGGGEGLYFPFGCFPAPSNLYNSTNLSGSQSLYSTFTVGGAPANSSNATINYVTPLPPGVVVYPNGTFAVTSLIPQDFVFNFQICAIGLGFCSAVTTCRIRILPTNLLNSENLTYNTSGQLISGSGITVGGIYNVLSNDSKQNCNNASINDYSWTSPLVLTTGMTLTSPTTTPYFTITSSGNVQVNTGVGGSSLPTGTYTLNYTVCSATGICATQYVYISVINGFKMSIPVTNTKTIVPKGNATTKLLDPFPIDANLKAKLLQPATCINTTNSDYIAADYNGDGVIDATEALAIGRVNLAQGNISNLTGLEHFTNLNSVFLAVNNVSSFDVPLPNLSVLALYSNPTTYINNSVLPMLTGLGLDNTQVSTLNLTSNPLLNELWINNSLLNTIDLGANPNMTKLICSNTPNLTTINIKNTSSLDYTDAFMLQDCWVNCPNLTTICADSSEIPALQSFLSGCGVATSGININSSCALAVEMFEDSAVTVYPNPVTNVVNVNLNNPTLEKTSYMLYNGLGQKVLEKESAVETNTFVIDMENYANGVYLLQIKIGDKIVIKKVVKQ